MFDFIPNPTLQEWWAHHNNRAMVMLSQSQAPFLTDAPVERLFAAFPEHSLRFVGGCVRNALWNETVSDIDFATTLEPDAVVEALKSANIRSVPTGIEHGTVTAVIKGKPYEITSLRKDVETDGRRAVVAFTTDWELDARRRDFTVNALYADSSGTVFDPIGDGLKDIERRKFRFVGDAADRVKEDYLRILRLFRFVAWYGQEATICKNALQACRENRNGLTSLSAERIWAEVKKLLSARDPSRSVRIMLQQGILETVLPEATNSDGLDQLVRLEARENIAPDPLLRLMAMMAREPLSAALLSKRLKMSRKERDRLKAWAGDGEMLTSEMPEQQRLQAIYRSGKETILDRARLRAAGAEDPLESTRWMTLADLAMGWTPPKFPLKGRDVIAAGVPKGPTVSRAMEALEKLWIRSGFARDKDELLAALKILGYGS